MASLLGLASFSKLSSAADDDWVDRLNHLWTVVILVIFAVFISGGQYVGSPIECWTPAHFTGAFVSYTKSYCWVKNTYYIPTHQDIPTEHHRRDSEELTYYQWVPIILMFMAFLFKFPCMVWRAFNSASAINLDKIVQMTTVTQIGSGEKRKETIIHIAQYMDRWLEAHRHHKLNIFVRMRQRLSKVFCFCWGKRDGTYLTGLYIVVKALYVTNVICQFFLLNGFLGGWYNLYGFEVMAGLMNDADWNESRRFPKVTLCDFDIRQLQNVQRYTVQCVLPINLFNEKVFIFLWFWICLVALITTGNALFWLYRVLFHQSRVGYIKKYLKSLNQLKSLEDKSSARRFADNFLRDDGIFVLRLVAKNSNDILLAELISELYSIYKNKSMTNNVSHNDEKPKDESHA